MKPISINFNCGTDAEKLKKLEELQQIVSEQRFMRDYIVDLDDRIHALEVNKKQHHNNKPK